MTYVADFSFAKPTPKELADAGYAGGIGYCSHDAPKNLTWDTTRSFIEAGIRMALVWETVNQRASQGHQAGLDDATEFLRQALAINATGGTLWMVAEDPTQEPSSDYANIDAYFATAAPIIRGAGFKIGGYGSEAYLVHAKNAGLIDRMWFVGGWSRNTSPDLTQQSSNPGKSTLGGKVDCNWSPSDSWGWTEFTDPTKTNQKGDDLFDQTERDKLDAVWGAVEATDAAKDPDGKPMNDHWAISYIWTCVQGIDKRMDSIEKSISALASKGQ